MRCPRERLNRMNLTQLETLATNLDGEIHSHSARLKRDTP